LAEVKAYYAGDRDVQEALIQGYAQSGYRGALRRAADLQAARARRAYVAPTDIAGNYGWAGDREQALAWLEKGLAVRDGNMAYITVQPWLEAVRDSPRFWEIARRMNLPE
jgi:hypothetical protein